MTEKGDRGFGSKLVYLFEQLMPDPFVPAIGLTMLVAVSAAIFAPHNSLSIIVTSWYTGTPACSIFGFAFQMIIILVTVTRQSSQV
jgi:short-chain fatty acids transporter